MASGANSSRKKLVISALCKHFSLDSSKFSDDNVENDIKSVYNILKSSLNEESIEENDQVFKWIAFAESFPSGSDSCHDALKRLNEELVTVSVLLGNGLTPSSVDVIVFAALHSSVIGLPSSEKTKFPHLMRWMDYIQNKVNFGDIFEKVLLKKSAFEPHVQEVKLVEKAKVEVASDSKKTEQSKKGTEKKAEAEQNTKKSDVATGSKEASKEKKKAPEPEKAKKDEEVSVSLLNIQVGQIRKACKHPSADSLLVEEIDVGEAKLRQVVSGLAKYCTPEQLTNRLVVLITNVKPGKLRDVVSEGLVLCASNEDHTAVEPLLPPQGAVPGERISFLGIDGKPEEVLNPKKKQLDKITPNLFTDENGVATFKGVPFMTSAGPCTSSIAKGTIK